MKKMNRNLKTTLTVFMLFCFTTPLLPQGFGGGQGRFGMRNQFGSLLFQHAIYNFKDGENSLLDFHYSFVNDLLTFIKTDDDQYKARYELNLVIYDSDKRAVTEQSASDEVIVPYFADTNSRRNPIMGNLQVSLPPGEYYYKVTVIENDVPSLLVPETRIQLRTFTDGRLHASDIVFADKLETGSLPYAFEPNINLAFSELNSVFSAFFYIYPNANKEAIQLSYQIHNDNGYKIKSLDTTLVAQEDMIPYVINFKDMITKPDLYEIELQASSGEQKFKTQKHFTVQWGKVPMQENNVDLAIEQLKIVANRKTIEKLNEADENKKQEMFDRFWDERDPTPETPENELKEEFLARVNFCNQNFIESYPGKGGWSTDRGRVYIKYGPPTQVERQQASINTPGVEIWYYATIDRSYVFTDRDNNGTYRLIKIE